MRQIKDKRVRRAVKIIVPFVLIPTAVVVGTLAFNGKRHLFVSLFVVVLADILFISGFEKKEIGTRRSVLVAVMTALSVVGRFIPFFKPITALTVISAMYLGGEAGFMTGALSALISNIYFGQGPWTPFQMLAWGLIGYFAGFLSRWLQRSRPLLLIYGVISGVVFSLVMDVWTVLWYADGFNASLYLSAIVTALPHTTLYSVSNVLFLYFLAEPFGEKLRRIKVKYGV